MMRSRTNQTAAIRLSVLVIVLISCNLLTAVQPEAPGPSGPTDLPDVVVGESPAPEIEVTAPATLTPAVAHLMTPSSPGEGKVVYDVESEGTAPEKRAPYGDSYRINRLERPFLQDMTYVPDLDIQTYTVASDETWWYVSIDLIGTEPNDSLGIHYGVELDLDHDGFGDYLLWAHPPYATAWDTAPVEIYQDKNHDTGGLSAEQSDAPLVADGYETLIFHGGQGDSDPDIAWVQINAGFQATVQFAFKRSWSGNIFMLGVLADAGLKDPKQLDYVDRFKLEEAGSPLTDNNNYPLKKLYAVDNVCREAFGFHVTGYEPQLCPRDTPVPSTKKPPTPTPQICLAAGTLIDTPTGQTRVEDLRAGDLIWSVDSLGRPVQVPIVKTSRAATISEHHVVHIRLDDGRAAWISPGHPTADGRTVGDLQPGDMLDGARVAGAQLVSYSLPATYDILPAGETGYYRANGILMGSTLFHP